MAYTTEGLIEIDIRDWVGFAEKYLPCGGKDLFVLGLPRVNKSNSTIEVDFASSSDTSPWDWGVKPKAVLQWEGK